MPIIFITAINKEQKHIFKGYESGAVDYLFKPIEPEILKSKVAIFLELYRQKKLLKEQAMLLDFKVQELLETKHQLEEANRLLERLSVLDGLTGIANRRRFDTFLDFEWRRALREGKPLSLIMADIDFFKDFNDRYGHQAGDECLRKVAATMSGALMRPTDLLARYGGEEFAAVLPETSADGVYHIAKFLKESVENLVIPHVASTIADHVTISLGTCSIVPGKDMLPDTLIAAADQALYQAKQAGRNRIVSLSR